VPGIGATLAAVIACEINVIERFGSAEKLCTYAKVVPTTYASGGKVAHGRLFTFLQQVAALGPDRSELGRDWIFGLLWCLLPTTSRSRQEA